MESKKTYIVPEISSDVPFLSDIVCGATLSGGGTGGPGSAEAKETEEEDEEEFLQFISELENEERTHDSLW